MFASSHKLNNFFHEPEQFQFLEDWIMRQRKTRLAILALGCGQGQEAYSIALVCERVKSKGFLRSYHIDVVDSDPLATQKCRRGEYPVAALQEIPEKFREFTEIRADVFGFKDSIASQIQFLTGNIFDSPIGEKQLYNAAFCRQMLSYKKRDAARHIVDDIEGHLHNGGLLFLSEGDKVFLPSLGFVSESDSIYSAVRNDKIVSLKQPTSPSGMQILLIEDDPDIRVFMSEYIRSLHAHVEIASSAKEAKNILAEKNYDLVITDFKLPDGTAKDILQFVRQEKKRNDMFVVLSGYSSTEMNRELSAFSVVTIVQKPITPAELSQLLTRLKKTA